MSASSDAINLNKLASVTHWSGDSTTGPGEDQRYRPDDTVYDANVVTSELKDGSGLHSVVLDIDLNAELVPSSTPGHFHLYIDKAMPWEDYKDLLSVLARVGIVEPGYVGASFARGFTAVRLPWVKKEPPEELTATAETLVGEDPF